jgi:hypothetical protein
LLSGAYFNEFNAGRRCGYGLTVLSQSFDVKLNGFLNEFENLVSGFRHGGTTWQIGNVRPETSFALFNHDGIFHIYTYFKPACFRMLFNVPGGTSMPGFPDTVTVPRFVGCLN